jgi:hypothetical protein
MSVDLIAARKFGGSPVTVSRLKITNNNWRLLLALARCFGWKAKFTNRPPQWEANESWDGSYCRNEGQRVSREDALGLLKALKKARRHLSDQSPADRAQIEAKVCNRSVSEEEVRKHADTSPIGEALKGNADFMLNIPADLYNKLYPEFPDYCHKFSRQELLSAFSGEWKDEVECLIDFLSPAAVFHIY